MVSKVSRAIESLLHVCECGNNQNLARRFEKLASNFSWNLFGYSFWTSIYWERDSVQNLSQSFPQMSKLKEHIYHLIFRMTMFWVQELSSGCPKERWILSIADVYYWRLMIIAHNMVLDIDSTRQSAHKNGPDLGLSLSMLPQLLIITQNDR